MLSPRRDARLRLHDDAKDDAFPAEPWKTHNTGRAKARRELWNLGNVVV
ncbi:hypothetical protein QE374_002587 [Microbacterium sp. SORGH_AS428]|nr:hypothetical protein [Microbacterium sp. SORGH_AS_0428]